MRHSSVLPAVVVVLMAPLISGATSDALPPPLAERACGSSYVVLAQALTHTRVGRSTCSGQSSFLYQDWCYEEAVELKVVEVLRPKKWMVPAPMLLNYFPLRLGGGLPEGEAIYFIGEIKSPSGVAYQLLGQNRALGPLQGSELHAIRDVLASCAE